MTAHGGKRFSLVKPALIGVVHLAPLPGAPRYGGDLGPVLAAAEADAAAYVEGGADAIIFENFGDMPFASGVVGPETVAAMAAVAVQVQSHIPFGFNVLRNDALAALGLAVATGGSFIRVNVHAGAMITDQGLIEGDAFGTIRARLQFCPEAAVWADVHVKHAQPLGASHLPDAARETLERGLADGVIISGTATGKAPELADLRVVREACPEAWILAGSGACAENAREALEFADGFIVGTSVKRDGAVTNPVDARRVRRLREAMDRASSSD